MGAARDLALAGGGAAVGAGLTYLINKGGGAGIPAAIRHQASRMEAYVLPSMDQLDIIGLMPFVHFGNVKGGLYAVCFNGPDDENNPVAVMKVWISGTTVVYQLGQIADADIWFSTKEDPHYTCTLSGLSAYITCPVA